MECVCCEAQAAWGRLTQAWVWWWLLIVVTYKSRVVGSGVG